jgi:aarF domain-containing kinase
MTFEQQLLDTSEEERRVETYGDGKDRSIFYRFFKLLKITFIRYIFEPIATGLRFLQLVAIFVPVFATVPVIFIGSRYPEHDNERTGTLWWYRFLVKQMERAGPTFIKVDLMWD